MPENAPASGPTRATLPQPGAPPADSGSPSPGPAGVLPELRRVWGGLRQSLAMGLDGLSLFPAAAVIFACLMLCNYSHLFNPPHWDDLIGLHNQALFLAKNNFNLWALWHEQVTIHPYFNIGEGSNVYPYSAVAMFWAVLYRLFSPPWVHASGRLCYMLCLTLAGVLFFDILRRLTRSGGRAAAFTLLAFMEPVMSGRTAAIGQECPLILGCMLALMYWSREQTGKALATAALSIFLRDTAGIFMLIILLAFVIERIALRWRRQRPGQWRRELAGTTVALAAGALFALYILATRNIFNRPEGLSLAGHIGRTLWVHIPYISALWLLAVILLARHTFRALKSRDGSFSLSALLWDWGLLSVYAAILFCMIFIVCSLPRYMSAAVFPVFLVLGKHWPGGNKGIVAGILLFLLLAIQPFPPLRPMLGRSGEFLERSREYLADVKANQKLCAYLEREHFGRPIVAKWPYILMFTVPEFGYVSRPLAHVYVAELVAPNFAPVKVYAGREKLPADTVFIFTPTSLGHTILPLFPYRHDRILYVDTTLGSSVIAFQRRQTPR